MRVASPATVATEWALETSEAGGAWKRQLRSDCRTTLVSTAQAVARKAPAGTRMRVVHAGTNRVVWESPAP